MQVPFTVVAILWAWMAIAYHLLFFTDIIPMAYLFAAMFALQAALIIWYTFKSGRFQLATSPGRTQRTIGFALIAYALLIYPVLGYVLGQRYPEIPIVSLVIGVFIWQRRTHALRVA